MVGRVRLRMLNENSCNREIRILRGWWFMNCSCIVVVLWGKKAMGEGLYAKRVAEYPDGIKRATTIKDSLCLCI